MGSCGCPFKKVGLDFFILPACVLRLIQLSCNFEILALMASAVHQTGPCLLLQDVGVPAAANVDTAVLKVVAALVRMN